MLEFLQQPERVCIVRTRARLFVQPRHGLEIVVHDVGRGFRQDLQSAIETTAEIRDQHLDPRPGRNLAQLADAVPEMAGPAVAQVVAVHTGDHDVRELQRRDRLGQIRGLVGIERQRPAVTDVAEWATPRADVAHDHERRRAFAEAFADVRAGGFLADGVQMVLAQDLLDLVEARARWGANTDPRRLREPFARDDLDGDARSFRSAGLLHAGRVVAGGSRCVAHVKVFDANREASIGANSAPAWSTVLTTSKSASWVTARPG